MSETQASTTDDHGPGRYEIRIKGRLDERWAGRLAGLTFTYEYTGMTSLSGVLADQAALHGVLNRIRDLGLPIISVQRIGPSANTQGKETS